MRVVQQVLHRSARAISLSEFHDALYATCKPRFPEARGLLHRPVALAISGGVDSMALAFLCSQIRRYDPNIVITDNPCSGFRGIVIDHMLREESTAEAAEVVKALTKLDLPAEFHQVNWKKELGDTFDIADVTNLESMARKIRYRRLGRLCAFKRMATMLVAHHEDDQYETVLMRLLAGHRNRALRGMRKAAGIPECEGEFGAFDSGWVDDQNRETPFYVTRLSKRQRRALKRDLRSSISQVMEEEEPPQDLLGDLQEYDSFRDDDWVRGNVMKFDASAELGTMPIEDGGVSIYRPLLEFSKDRLIATCLENNVPWFEDGTNRDPTLTTRNSIRHMYRSCELPRALQKPSIIALSKSWQRRAEAQDAEAKRMLERIVIHDFEPHVGTIVVQFPELPSLKTRRYTRTQERYQRRVSRQRLIAALAIQRIIALVSPELSPPAVANLQNVVSRLFPTLAEISDDSVASLPKAFNIAGLHFKPIQSPPQSATASADSYARTWYISRQPHSTTALPPHLRVPYWSVGKQGKRRPRTTRWKWSTWLPWHFWDNRFWVRLSHRLPYRVIVMPFLSEHAKDFRESLRPKDRVRLATVLKEFAPGKVRYTLPAIYSEEYVDLENVVARTGYPVPESQLTSDTPPERQSKTPLAPIVPSKMRLLALPTLDLQLPGLEKWLLHEIRYKRADKDTLRTMGSYSRGSFAIPKRLEAKGRRSAGRRGKWNVRIRRPFGKKQDCPSLVYS
ncbi:pp-loop family protein [Seiridium cupressi]